jgi:hypothetical protein
MSAKSPVEIEASGERKKITPSAATLGSAAPTFCAGCDWWKPRRTADGMTGLVGWCDAFKKTTNATHGSRCTAWTRWQEPPNDEASEPGTMTHDNPKPEAANPRRNPGSLR